MQIVIRLILALLLVMQSLRGAAMMQCAPMGSMGPGSTGPGSTGPGGEAISSVHPAACPCCSGGDESAVSACPTGPAVCSCGEQQQDAPKAPLGDPGSKVYQLLVILPAELGFTSPEPMSAMVARPAVETGPHRPTKSIQSLLCVWVV